MTAILPESGYSTASGVIIGAHGEVAQLLRAGVEDLVRHLRPTGRTGDEIPGADGLASRPRCAARRCR